MASRPLTSRRTDRFRSRLGLPSGDALPRRWPLNSVKALARPVGRLHPVCFVGTRELSPLASADRSALLGCRTIPSRINQSERLAHPRQIEGAIRAAFDTWGTGRASAHVRLPGTDHGAGRDRRRRQRHRLQRPHVREHQSHYRPLRSCGRVRHALHAERLDVGAGPTGKQFLHANSGQAGWPAVTNTPMELHRYACRGPRVVAGRYAGQHTGPPPHHVPGPHPAPAGFPLLVDAFRDLLGVRTLYPCSCPLPPIYDP